MENKNKTKKQSGDYEVLWVISFGIVTFIVLAVVSHFIN